MMLSLLLAALPAPDVVLFNEPGFPPHGGLEAAPTIEKALVASSGEELAQALAPENLLVWWHGSTFPAEAWPAFEAFLEQGGSFLSLAGEPLTRFVDGTPGKRKIGPRTLRMLETLRLDRVDWVSIRGGELIPASGVSEALRGAPLTEDSLAFALDPRFSDTKDFAHEDGSPGSRDARLLPLSHVYRSDNDNNRPIAAGAVAIDRLRGRFAGGRWVLRLLSGEPTADETGELLRIASQPPVDLRIDPTFGSFHEGERPSVRITLHRPRALGRPQDVHVSVALEGPGGESHGLPDVHLSGGEHTTAQVALPMAVAPGLYRVKASLEGRATVETGFWIRDEELFRSGDALSFDGYTMLRNGQPEPVMGTTTMSATVHRDYLFEPNAAVWDDTFGELAGMGVNLVRTGVWSGFRKIAVDPDVVDESFLRALEAYYLTARRHGIPILFTFFAFVPERFGGDNPYFDPRALEGQRAYVSAIVERFADTREMLWDLINEPSFSSPDQLWKCRPHGDAFEAAAFRKWLAERFGNGERPWEAIVRDRWRLAPGEPIGLPSLADFEERNVFEKARPYRAKEYLHFAQDAFRDWALNLRTVIRDAGSEAAITVGQDEGGLNERPHPLFHADAVEFTSMHTWWYNDRLLWDAVCAKAPGKPLLVSETGIMNREALDGTNKRSPEQRARLTSRKIAAAFAGGAFGAVLWCYETNPFMASDNEVAIGLKRVDGSFKPEHDVFREYARFVHANRRYFKGYAEPGVVLILPSSDSFGPRSFQRDGTWRALEALTELGHVPRVVPEHRIELLGTPNTIILPACRGLSDTAWKKIYREAVYGSNLIASGWFETDDAGLPAERLGYQRRALAGSEFQGMGFKHKDVRFPREVVESWYATEMEGISSTTAGRFLKSLFHFNPLPLEWAERTGVLKTHYAIVLGESWSRITSSELPPGVLTRQIDFDEATLVVLLSDSSSDHLIELGGRKFLLRAGAGLCVLFDLDGSLIDSTKD